MNYQFANINEENNHDVVTYPNRKVNDHTVFKNRRLGDFVDFINGHGVDSKYHINKLFFYDVVSIEFIDPVFVNEKSILLFKKLMAHCISISNEFRNDEVLVNKCLYNYNDRTVYRYWVTYNGKEDIWIMTNVYGKKQFYFKNGRKLFKSDMFSDETIEAWENVVENFFFTKKERVNSKIIPTKKVFLNSYQFANTLFNDNGIIVFPNGAVNDDTVIRDMEIGIFLNFVNSLIIEDHCEINKSLFFDLISVEVVDSMIVDMDTIQTFNKKIAYCLAISKAFGNDDIRINNAIFEYNDYNLHRYNITINGLNDLWTVDGDRDQFYTGNHNECVTFPYKNKDNEIEYISILDREKSISMWVFIVDTFYNSSVETLEYIVSSNLKNQNII